MASWGKKILDSFGPKVLLEEKMKLFLKGKVCDVHGDTATVFTTESDGRLLVRPKVCCEQFSDKLKKEWNDWEYK
ncbi:hypothetical protein I2712_002340 [Vibrio fluvialis]|nr:hypothetical protein [Vibrio fluvialis]ELF6479739.1 hypothetical protein [Vibrio fluvialis]